MWKWKSLFIVAALCVTIPPAHAQFLGYASPQTVTKTILSDVAFICDGTEQDVNVPNYGQAVHYVAYRLAENVATVSVGIQGSMDGNTWLPISDVATNLPLGAVAGFGYYPVTRVVFTCTGGGPLAVQVNYSGTSVATGVSAGVNDFGAYEKLVVNDIANSAGTTVTTPITPTPYGNTSGVIYATFDGTGPAGSTVSVSCNLNYQVDNPPAVQVLAPATLATTDGTTQTFVVPSLPCPEADITYTAGSTSASGIHLSYLFSKPGAAAVMGGSGSSVTVTNDPLNVNMSQFGAQAVPGLGQFTASFSLPVVIASDQSPINVNVASGPAISDPCRDPSIVPASEVIFADGANAEIVSAVGGQTIFVCGFSISFADNAAGNSNGLLVTGTGSVCASGTVQKALFNALTVGQAISQSLARDGSVFVSAPGEAVCAFAISGTGILTGILTYVQE